MAWKNPSVVSVCKRKPIDPDWLDLLLAVRFGSLSVCVPDNNFPWDRARPSCLDASERAKVDWIKPVTFEFLRIAIVKVAEGAKTHTDLM